MFCNRIRFAVVRDKNVPFWIPFSDFEYGIESEYFVSEYLWIRNVLLCKLIFEMNPDIYSPAFLRVCLAFAQTVNQAARSPRVNGKRPGIYCHVLLWFYDVQIKIGLDFTRDQVWSNTSALNGWTTVISSFGYISETRALRTRLQSIQSSPES